MVVNVDGQVVPSEHGLLSTVGFKLGKQPCVYALEGSIACTGSTVQWMRDNLNVSGLFACACILPRLYRCRVGTAVSKGRPAGGFRRERAFFQTPGIECPTPRIYGSHPGAAHANTMCTASAFEVQATRSSYDEEAFKSERSPSRALVRGLFSHHCSSV